MNVALRSPLTTDAFLDWEARQDLRYEFDGLRIIAMTGGTAAHAAIQINLTTALRQQLRGRPCRPFGSELKLRLAGRIRYPDAFVICSPVEPSATWVSEPVVVFEILSESTSHEDLVNKNAEYQAAPSIQRYVILEQTHAAALVFSRKGGAWVAEPLSGSAAVLHMPEIGIAIPLAEIYADVGLPAEQEEQEA